MPEPEATIGLETAHSESRREFQRAAEHRLRALMIEARKRDLALYAQGPPLHAALMACPHQSERSLRRACRIVQAPCQQAGFGTPNLVNALPSSDAELLGACDGIVEERETFADPFVKRVGEAEGGEKMRDEQLELMLTRDPQTLFEGGDRTIRPIGVHLDDPLGVDRPDQGIRGALPKSPFPSVAQRASLRPTRRAA